eukprot:gb/GECG01005115.1/.p1 GENE.gb/GECG01005115.1/~~gb/GECG01005115.1/.p1  ORF type:complete len:222 (+),score=16.92 gb/GECG01005115.1/:1-666(+)
MGNHWSFYVSRIVCNIVGNVYPAYASYRAVSTGSPSEHKQWLTYWIINTFFTIFEIVADVLISWVPLYYEAKIAFILWLTLPRFRGATWLYEKVVAKYLEAYEADIDAHLDTLQRTAGERINHITRQGSEHIRQKSGQILSMMATLVAQAGQHTPQEGLQAPSLTSPTEAGANTAPASSVSTAQQSRSSSSVPVSSPKSPSTARIEERMRHRRGQSGFPAE